jgi:5-methylcytosine-specific restriction endonuclease McrA
MVNYKQCSHCGQGFKPKNARHRFCCQDCAHPIRNCELCGKPFRSKLHEQTYCSNKCSGEAKRNRVMQVCEYCGNGFEQVKSHADLGLKTFCSHDCYSKSMEIKIKVECEQCGLIFERPPARISERVFCSHECRYKNWQGENNPNWKTDKVDRGRGDNWDIQRRKVLKRDNKKCQICGYKHSKTKKRRYIDVHHIIPYREFNGDWQNANKLSNLITLCRSCHSKVEKGKIPCPQRLL